MHDYNQGYKDALENIDQVLTQTLMKKGGGITMNQIGYVFNDFIKYLHKELDDVNTVMNQDKKEMSGEEFWNGKVVSFRKKEESQ